MKYTSLLKPTSLFQQQTCKMMVLQRQKIMTWRLSNSSVVSTQDNIDDMTTAQPNLLPYLIRHKSTALKHDGMANHFHAIATSDSSYPPYMILSIELCHMKSCFHPLFLPKWMT